MPSRPVQALEQLEGLRFAFGRTPAKRKLVLLERLRGGELDNAAEVARLHEALCFVRAYPDDRRMRSLVDLMLGAFSERADLTRHMDELVNSGIAGTEVRFRFYWFTLSRLVRRWPGHVWIDWPDVKGARLALLDRRLTMLMPYCESLALEEAALPTSAWIDRLKGPLETDAEFVVGRFEAMRADPMPRESVFEEMDLSFRFFPGPDTPASTRHCHERSPVVYQKRLPERSRKTFPKQLAAPPLSARAVGKREARELIDMAISLMVTRTRDLDCFIHGDEDDVRILDYPEGFQLVAIGTRVERRQLLDAAYGFLMLRNGALIGYVLSASLFGSTEAAYNVSPTYRGAEAAHLYARCLHAMRSLFGSDAFMVDPYQMGHENPEGLRSGAWWFYYKLGFRPRDPTIARMAEAEQQKVRDRPGYKSSLAKLNRLSSVNMYLHLGEERDDIIGEFSRGNVGLRIVRYLAGRFGADREQGIARCAREVADRVGVRLADLSPGERLVLERWAPLVSILPDLDSWSGRDLSALGRVMQAKAGRRESDFVRLFDRHRRLRQEVFELSTALDQ